MAIRSVRRLPASELGQLTRARIDAYRKKLLALHESAATSDVDGRELAGLDPTRLYFKDDPVWQETHGMVVALLARMLPPSRERSSDRRRPTVARPTCPQGPESNTT